MQSLSERLLTDVVELGDINFKGYIIILTPREIYHSILKLKYKYPVHILHNNKDAPLSEIHFQSNNTTIVIIGEKRRLDITVEVYNTTKQIDPNHVLDLGNFYYSADLSLVEVRDNYTLITNLQNVVSEPQMIVKTVRKKTTKRFNRL